MASKASFDIWLNEIKAEIKAEVKQELLEELAAKPEPSASGHNWVGIDEVIRQTGWGRSTIERWRNEGRFLTMRKSEHGKVHYDLNDINRFLRQVGKQKKFA